MPGSKTTSKQQLELRIQGGLSASLDVKSVQKVVHAINKLQPSWLRSGLINLRLVDDADIRALNREHSGNDYATDVLSFSYIQSMPSVLSLQPAIFEKELGDMVISLETAARQAVESNSTLSEEVALLVAHGIMHIHGLDHQDKPGQVAMDQLQCEIMTSAGLNYRDFKWL